MQEKNRNQNYKIRQVNGNSMMNFIGFLLIIILGALLIAYCIMGKPTCNGIANKQVNSLCNDCQSCTIDSSIGTDNACLNEPVPNGEPCASSDLCFNHSKCTPTCQEGQCISDILECCNGYCNSTEDCPNITSITGSIGKTCVTEFNSCQYRLQDANTDDCLSLIEPIEFRNCLNFVFLTGFSINGTCTYYYNCAPIFAGTSIPDVFEILNVTKFY